MNLGPLDRHLKSERELTSRKAKGTMRVIMIEDVMKWGSGRGGS